MARFYGNVGYVLTEEVERGVWTPSEEIVRPYYGEMTRNTSKFQTSGGVNDNITTANEVSIVADPYAIEHFMYIRYIEVLGAKWKVDNVEVKYPRLILTVGGVWDGN